MATVSRSFADLAEQFGNPWFGSDLPVLAAGAVPPLDLDLIASDEERMMYADAVGYLPDDILCKVDRASMAVSLETRVPFLDHRVAEIAARLPLAQKVSGGEGKHILHQLLYRHVPRALVDRPKAGFGVPVGDWIRGPLRDWAEELLDERSLGQEGYLDPRPIRRVWHEHLQGSRDLSPALWPVLMFQQWLRAN
jgi:asparagine synthase (glutamine-hydrolysing)